ncbi:REP-associated tyrosine transposase [Massilia sp. TN1-12]|uniref:REP-associated tyrosine transposase n=1 Tax=Massilia paldalensis TaxID=3377675 RepID=UPI00384F39D1
MPRYLRSRTGSVFFFTLVTFNRRPILCTAPIRHALRCAILNLRATRPFAIDGWVLMPDHLHCIWTLPEGDHDYSTRWALLKRSVSHFATDIAPMQRTPSACKHREAAIWQRRFWEHQLRDEADVERHLDYIHYNPVRHGYVKRAIDWPYSTIHRYVKNGVYPADWGGGNPDWGNFE